MIDGILLKIILEYSLQPYIKPGGSKICKFEQVE